MRRASIAWPPAIAAIVSLLAACAAYAGPVPTELPLPLRMSLPALSPHIVVGNTTSVTLTGGPTIVTVNDIDYRMRFVAQQFPGGAGGQAESFLEVDLSRTAPAAVGTARQYHIYQYQPFDPFTFTWTHTSLAAAHLDTATTIAPDQLTTDFAASGAVTTTQCRRDGGRPPGTKRTVAGTLSYGQLSFDTGTAFFGVLSQQPVQARLTVDPGCNVPYPVNSGCQPREELISGARDSFAIAVLNYRGTRAFQALLFSRPVSAVNFVSRFAESPVSPVDMPKPRHSSTGATAHFHTTGDPFMTGSATFHSARAPSVSTVRRCFAFGRWHRFRGLTYRGRIHEDANPLTVLFDTGAYPWGGRPDATLRLRDYLS